MERRRARVSVTIDRALYELAKAYGLSFSDVLETALAYILESRYGIKVTTRRIEKLDKLYEKMRGGR